MRNRPMFFLKIAVAVSIICILAVYFFHQAEAYLFGPQITIEQPKNGETVSNSFISIKGRVVNAVSLWIDGQVILTDSFGNFEKSLILARGYNIIGVSAKDKFGRTLDKKLEVVFK